MKLNSMLAGAALALATAAGAAGAQAATLAGDTIHAYYIYPNDGAVLNDLGTFTAPGGGHVYIESYQVTGNQLIVTADPNGVYWTNANYNGLKFVDESGGPTITGLTLDGASTANGVAGAVASWTANSFEVNFAGEQWGGGQQAIFDIQFGGGVPEPASWGLMLAGFFGLGAMLRARKTILA